MAPHNGLTHLKEYDVKDSNVELIGTDIDHRVKYASAATEPAWNNGVVGARAGLYVWRIEDFAVVPVPAVDVGVFYDGDSYIVLHSYQVGRRDGSSDRLGHDIFFWLGAHTSQDEAGVAAYKTVELDEFLQGAATQHRELQASPSAAFLRLFPRITIRRGGVRTGFRHVDETVEEARASDPQPLLLLRVFKQPGARTDGGVVVHEVPAQASSLDDGDVFILDGGSSTNHTVYVWQGRNSQPMEKLKAAEVAQDLVTPAHTGGVQVLAQDEGRAGIVARLLTEAGGEGDSAPEGPGSYAAARPSFGSSSSGSSPARPQKLWRLSDASGALSFDLVREGGASLRDFDSSDVFLWDDAGRDVWVWEGRGASAVERAQWLQVAQAYVRHLAGSGADGSGSAHLTPVAKVRDGYESPAFLESLQAVY